MPKSKKAQRISAYRSREVLLARSRTAESTRLIRRVVTLGPLACQLGLDQVAGVVRAVIVDHGNPDLDGEMPVGQAHVEVRGGDPAEVFEQLRKGQAPGVLLTVRVRRPRLRDRFVAWLRWTVWRLFRDERRRA